MLFMRLVSIHFLVFSLNCEAIDRLYWRAVVVLKGVVLLLSKQDGSALTEHDKTQLSHLLTYDSVLTRLDNEKYRYITIQ